MNKDNLLKAIRCASNIDTSCIDDNGGKCTGCSNYQMEYEDDAAIIQDLYHYAMKLEKSNRNWRRKCQRLRAKIADEDLAQ